MDEKAKEPAIAKKDEEYELLSGEKVGRRAGEVLNKNLDTLESLKKVKDTIGEELFEAQYPTPYSPKVNIKEGCAVANRILGLGGVFLKI